MVTALDNRSTLARVAPQLAPDDVVGVVVGLAAVKAQLSAAAGRKLRERIAAVVSCR
jgi:hypothetical protein